jgi:hypothetical protein
MNKMRKRIGMILAICLAALLLTSRGFAQDGSGGLQLGLTRDFGYGGIGEIQGSFSLKIIDPPPGLERVEFFLDSAMVHQSSGEPFIYKFSTGDFADGRHTMSAVGYLSDGTSLESNRISKTFLSSEDAWSLTRGIIAPLLIAVAALTLLGIGLPLLFSRSKEFILGKYGPAGGAVCPRCQLPFSRFPLAPNLLAGKLVRCPHCGKVSLQARASLSSLKEAEARYLGGDHLKEPGSAEEDLKREIDDSRFEE